MELMKHLLILKHGNAVLFVNNFSKNLNSPKINTIIEYAVFLCTNE